MVANNVVSFPRKHSHRETPQQHMEEILYIVNLASLDTGYLDINDYKKIKEICEKKIFEDEFDKNKKFFVYLQGFPKEKIIYTDY